jgi:hypothetical protein
MLLHIDGSRHQWFQDERWYDLLVILDDATSEIHYAQLVEEESTRTVLAAIREVVEGKGVFCAMYCDRASHFFVTPKAGGPVDGSRLTQVGRALKELSTEDHSGLFAASQGPHTVARLAAEGPSKIAVVSEKKKGCGKDALMETVGKSKPRTFPPFPQRLEIPHTTRDSHFPTAPTTTGFLS